MQNADSLVGNTVNDNSKYCFAKPGDVYVIYLPDGGSVELDLEDNPAIFKISWFNPRGGGALQTGSLKEVSGSGKVSLGEPPADLAEDWVILVRKT